MTQPYSPDDRPDPNDRPPALRARVPDHVARGVFSTGAIIMTGASEFIIDFAQSLGRPYQIVARIILPHPVLPQFVEALAKNIDLYRQRFGPLPSTPWPLPGTPEPAPTVQPPLALNASSSPSQGGGAPGGSGPSSGSPDGASPGGAVPPAPDSPSTNDPNVVRQSHELGAVPAGNESGTPGSNPASPPERRPTAQEIYDELKIRDEVLSGSYANAVMIGHGAHEFSFDFITSFYPQSAVSARVFVAAGQVGKLYESLKSTWDQYRQRIQPMPPPPPGPGAPPRDPNEPPQF